MFLIIFTYKPTEKIIRKNRQDLQIAKISQYLDQKYRNWVTKSYIQIYWFHQISRVLQVLKNGFL